jgi:hypothetical protein
MKKTIIILLTIVVLLSFGCRRTTPGLEPEVIEYHKGTQGLEINFIENVPPDEIIEGSEFAIGVELRNKGAYDIEDGRLLIYGFEEGYVSITPREIEFDIEGRSPGFPEGGYEIINFQGKNIAFPSIEEKIESPFTIGANYLYQTEAGAEVCINPDILGYLNTKEKVCEPKEVALSGGQGAPVAVTRIAQSAAVSGNKVKITFIIYFANKGDGKVISDVDVKEVRLANVPITEKCSAPSKKLKGNDEATITCTTEISANKGAYISPLSIKLKYDYIEQLDKRMSIKSLTAK